MLKSNFLLRFSFDQTPKHLLDQLSALFVSFSRQSHCNRKNLELVFHESMWWTAHKFTKSITIFFSASSAGILSLPSRSSSQSNSLYTSANSRALEVPGDSQCKSWPVELNQILGWPALIKQNNLLFNTASTNISIQVSTNSEISNYSLMRKKTEKSMSWPFYNPLWSFFGQLH